MKEPILLFIHGAGANHKIWENQTTHFNKTIAIDLPGHPTGAGKVTIDEYVEEVRRFCEEQQLKNIVMIGASMGGAIVQKFALNYPEYLKAIVLVSTGAKLKVLPIIFETIKGNYAQTLELFTKFAFSSNTTNEIKNKFMEEMRNITPEVVHADFGACDKFNVMDKLKEIKIPTLIICGLQDRLTPVKYSRYLKGNIQHSELEVIADAGHMVMLEKPMVFNEKLEKFVKKFYSI